MWEVWQVWQRALRGLGASEEDRRIATWFPRLERTVAAAAEVGAAAAVVVVVVVIVEAVMVAAAAAVRVVGGGGLWRRRPWRKRRPHCRLVTLSSRGEGGEGGEERHPRAMASVLALSIRPSRRNPRHRLRLLLPVMLVRLPTSRLRPPPRPSRRSGPLLRTTTRIVINSAYSYTGSVMGKHGVINGNGFRFHYNSNV